LLESLTTLAAGVQVFGGGIRWYGGVRDLFPPSCARASSMKRFLCYLVALALLVGGVGQAKAQPGNVYTTLDPYGSTASWAYGINDSTQMVGIYWDPAQHGYLLSGGHFTIIDAGAATIPFGINASGQIVGGYDYGHGFLFSGGRYTTLDVPGSNGTAAVGINSAGQIVGGYYTNGGDTSHGFLLSGGSYTTLDVPGSTSTLARGINASGQIVGWYTTGSLDGPYHGFVLNRGSYTTLDVPGSTFTIANGINALGQIVGWYGVDGNPYGHGFLLDNGGYTTLDVPGSIGTRVFGINDLDEIVGDYYNGRVHGFLLSSSKYTTFAPEPSTLLLLGIGTLGVIGWAWRRTTR